MEKERIHERWKGIPGYEGYYQVSTHGRIRSLDRYVGYRNDKQRFSRGKILEPGKDKDGYFGVILSKENSKKGKRVHRLVLTAFDRPPKPGEQCNHKDGNKQNNHIENLEWCTVKQNIWHKENILGKHNRGEKNGGVELTEQKVKEIRVLLEKGWTQRRIAKKFGVCKSTIGYIYSGKTWKHIIEK